MHKYVQWDFFSCNMHSGTYVYIIQINILELYGNYNNNIIVVYYNIM